MATEIDLSKQSRNLTLVDAKIANATISDGKLASSYVYADGTRAMTGNLDLGITNRIVNLAAPVALTDAATKGYVDGLSQGLDIKGSVASSSIINVASLSGITTVDGVALIAGNRVLLTGQTTATENGIWVIAAGAWTRPLDFAAGSSVAGAFTFVEGGTVRADTGWVCTTNAPADIVGTNNLSFTQFSGTGAILAGAGLLQAGATFDVVSADTSMTINADSLQVKRDAAGAITLDGGGAGIEVNIDNSSIEISANALQVKASGITGTHLNTSVAGAGLAGGGGAALSVNTGNGTQIVADAVVLGPLTADWVQSGAFDIVLDNAASELKIRSSDGAAFYGILDSGVHAADRTYTLSGGAAGTNTLWHNNNDGTGSGLDADLLDGLNSVDFLRATASSSLSTTFTLSVASGAFVDFAVAGGLRVGGVSLTTSIANLNLVGTIVTGEAAVRVTDTNWHVNGGASAIYTGTEQIYVNGLRQRGGGVDYTMAPATGQITFTYAVTVSDTVIVDYRR